MATTDSANQSELLAKLARLEEQVTALTLELEAKKRLTHTLEESNSEDRKKIADLEAALIIAQKSMLSRTTEIIRTYQQEIKSSFHNFALKSGVDQVQSLVDSVTQLTKQSKELFDRNFNLLKSGLQTVSEQMYQWPSLGKEYVDTVLLKKIKLQINELIQQINRFSMNLTRFTETKLIMPVSFIYKDSLSSIQALPEKIKYSLGNYFSDPKAYSNFSVAAKDKVVTTLQEMFEMISKGIKKLNQSIRTYVDEHSSRTIDHSLTPA